jgi:hypothetical protein
MLWEDSEDEFATAAFETGQIRATDNQLRFHPILLVLRNFQAVLWQINKIGTVPLLLCNELAERIPSFRGDEQ